MTNSLCRSVKPLAAASYYAAARPEIPAHWQIPAPHAARYSRTRRRSATAPLCRLSIASPTDQWCRGYGELPRGSSSSGVRARRWRRGKHRLTETAGKALKACGHSTPFRLRSPRVHSYDPRGCPAGVPHYCGVRYPVLHEVMRCANAPIASLVFAAFDAIDRKTRSGNSRQSWNRFARR
jgi:hypothetical protein